MANAVFVYGSAIRGFHVYRKSWTPEKGEMLDCFYESNNIFDLFAIKVCQRDSDKIVGHLPKEISRITKFILDRGAVISAEISCNHYRVSPLVQGGIEIPCNITIKTPPCFNLNVLKKYEDLVKKLYVEPKDEKILGTFILLNSQEQSDDSQDQESTEKINKKKKKVVQKQTKSSIKSADIRKLFKVKPVREKEGVVRQKTIPKPAPIAVIDDDSSDSE